MMMKKCKHLFEFRDCFIRDGIFFFLKVLKLSLASVKGNQLLRSCFCPPIEILQTLLAPLQLFFMHRAILYNTIILVTSWYHQLCMMQVFTQQIAENNVAMGTR